MVRPSLLSRLPPVPGLPQHGAGVRSAGQPGVRAPYSPEADGRLSPRGAGDGRPGYGRFAALRSG